MTQSRIDADELPYWLALARMPEVGPVTAQALLAQLGTPRHIFESGKDDLRVIGLLSDQAKAYLRQPDWAAVDYDIEWLDRSNCHIITQRDMLYPPLLKQIPDFPPVLFIQGDPTRLSDEQIAIVGSRNPTSSGEHTAVQFASHFANTGFTVTSGLAIGIDAAAHRGALAGGGNTIAVTGSGLDRIYPSRHIELANEIAEQGALVTEFPPGTPPRRQNFPRRNRLISALSLGTLVVEAALRSGSLITARLAAEQGREVFAIPGSIHNPLSRGCHALLRQGAKLVETTQDVLEELGALASWNENETLALPPVQEPIAAHDLAEFVNLIRHIGFEPTSIDTLVERSGLTADQVSSILMVLELQGQIVSAPGGLFSRNH
jgi:DNA processing protein